MAKQRNEQTNAFGLVLLAIIVGVLIESVTSFNLDFIPLIIGMFFAAFARRGATFAWIPAGLFFWLAVDDNLGLDRLALNDLPLPVLFITAGGVLLFRDRLPRGLPKAALIGLGVLGVLSVLTPDHPDRNRGPFFDGDGRPFRNSTTTANVQRGGPLPALTGKTLIINSRDGDVMLRTGAETSMLPEYVAVSATPQEVIVTNRDEPLDIVMPKGTKAIIVTRDGDLEIDDLSGGELTITSRDGNVDIEVDEDGEPTQLIINSARGNVDAQVLGDPKVDATAPNGDIDIDGWDDVKDPDKLFHHEGEDAHRVQISAASGDVELDRKERVLR